MHKWNSIRKSLEVVCEIPVLNHKYVIQIYAIKYEREIHEMLNSIDMNIRNQKIINDYLNLLNGHDDYKNNSI